jgi:hypothetical protein
MAPQGVLGVLAAVAGEEVDHRCSDVLLGPMLDHEDAGVG